MGQEAGLAAHRPADFPSGLDVGVVLDLDGEDPETGLSRLFLKRAFGLGDEEDRVSAAGKLPGQ